jgi:spermidine/putrescine-binding protein
MLMSPAEGTSLNRYIYSGKQPDKNDYNRVIEIFRRLKDNESLAYSNGMKVSDEQLAKVQEKL